MKFLVLIRLKSYKFFTSVEGGRVSMEGFLRVCLGGWVGFVSKVIV